MVRWAAEGLSDRVFKLKFEESYGFFRELHRQVFEDFFSKPVHEHGDRLFFVDTAALHVEELVGADA